MKMTDPATITPAQQANREELRTRIREQRYETIRYNRWPSLEHSKHQRPKRKQKLPACFIDAAANTAYIIARRTVRDPWDWPRYDQALTRTATAWTIPVSRPWTCSGTRTSPCHLRPHSSPQTSSLKRYTALPEGNGTPKLKPR